ncbi:hypothetical protein P0D72_12760 [Paraburkholderia sediminicola]|uniref:hypothetical protein n=1 Tax=Paraburkholderia sediminicola TaxID=458836 RepID=UPI0038BA088A
MMTDDPRSARSARSAHYARLDRAFEEKLNAIEAARAAVDDASDPGAAIEAINALREEALHMAIQVFAEGTLARVQATPHPTTEERAAAMVAERLATFPRDADAIKHWRVTLPYVFASKGSAWTVAQKRERTCCVVVCRLIRDGVPRDKAMEQAEKRFHKSRSWVSAAYYNNREEFQPLVKLERRETF